MKTMLSRIVQPRNPLFWLMIVLQVLSSIFMTLLTTADPLPALAWVLRIMVLVNAVIGLLILWKLMRGG